MGNNKKCVLYDKDCTNCGECNMCDLEPSKICDNCGKCIDLDNDYNTIDVDLINDENGMPLNYTYDDEISDDEEEYDDFVDGYDDFDELPDLDDEEFDCEEEGAELKEFFSDFLGDFQS